MKLRTIVTGAGLALLVCMPARASTPVTGTILVPNPGATYEKRDAPSSAGITRNLSPCNADGDFQGIDGFWIRVAPFQSRDAELTPASPIADFDVYFYDHWCHVLGYDGM